MVHQFSIKTNGRLFTTTIIVSIFYADIVTASHDGIIFVHSIQILSISHADFSCVSNEKLSVVCVSSFVAFCNEGRTITVRYSRE